MTQHSSTFTVDISGACLVGDDLRAALNSLPDEVKMDLAPVVKRALEMRLVAIDRLDGEFVSRPSPLFLALTAFIERLVDEIEVSKE
jgi:hypothetical protein